MVAAATLGAQTDPYWANVVFLAHADGANGATTMLDSSPSGFSVTGQSGSAISTAQPKFGTGSIAVDGTGYVSVTGSALNSVNLSGDFTIEGWVYLTNSGGQLVASGGGWGPGATYFSFGTTGIDFGMNNNGANTYFNPSGTIPQNTWTHLAACRSGSTLTLYVNGVPLGSTQSTLTYTFGSGGAMKIGRCWDGPGAGMAGYVDDVRITNGLARYSSSGFTVPTSAYPGGGPPTITSSLSVAGAVGVPFSYQITASGGASGFTATNLPAGLSVNTAMGVISGTPTATGVSSVTIGATNAGGATSATLSLTIGTTGSGSSTDSYFPNVILLTHADGTSGATTMVDSSNSGFTLAGQSGSSISNAQVKFGTGSIAVDGTSYVSVTGSALSSLNLSGDFTIEGWVYFTSTGGQLIASGCGWGAGATYFSFSTAGIDFGMNNGGTNTYFYPSATIPQSTWTHLAACRSGTTLTLYENGTPIGSTQSSLDYTFAAGGSMKIGHAWDGPGTGMAGYIDELRITNVARYNGSSFTPPAAPYPNGGAPIIAIIGGNNQSATVSQFNVQPFDIAVWNTTGTAPLVGTSITFNVQSGGGLLATTNTSWLTLSSSLTLTTDADGTAQAYYQQPAAANVTSQITAASNGAQATLTTQSVAIANPPSAPPWTHTNTTAPTAISLSWGSATPASGGNPLAGYYVYRNGTQLDSQPLIGTNYTDSAVTAGTAYSYTVKAVDTAGNLSTAATLNVAAPASSTSGTFDVYTPTP